MESSHFCISGTVYKCPLTCLLTYLFTYLLTLFIYLFTEIVIAGNPRLTFLRRTLIKFAGDMCCIFADVSFGEVFSCSGDL